MFFCYAVSGIPFDIDFTDKIRPGIYKVLISMVSTFLFRLPEICSKELNIPPEYYAKVSYSLVWNFSCSWRLIASIALVLNAISALLLNSSAMAE